jgi:hypothetical protein
MVGRERGKGEQTENKESGQNLIKYWSMCLLRTIIGGLPGNATVRIGGLTRTLETFGLFTFPRE